MQTGVIELAGAVEDKMKSGLVLQAWQAYQHSLEQINSSLKVDIHRAGSFLSLAIPVSRWGG